MRLAAALPLALGPFAGWAWVEVIRMPGASYQGPLAALTAEGTGWRERRP